MRSPRNSRTTRTWSLFIADLSKHPPPPLKRARAKLTGLDLRRRADRTLKSANMRIIGERVKQSGRKQVSKWRRGMLLNSFALSHTCSGIDRRDLMCGAALAALIVTLGGGARPARAQSLPAPPPEVDQLAIRVLIDSYQFAVAPSTKAGDVDIKHFGWGISPDKPPGKTLISEFG